jgi:hypothetical protein
MPLERALVKKHLARFRFNVRVEGGHLYAAAGSPFQGRRQRIGIISRNRDSVHPGPDPLVNDVCLSRHIGVYGSVKLDVHLEFLGRFLRPLVYGNEVRVAGEFGQHSDLFAFPKGGIRA